MQNKPKDHDIPDAVAAWIDAMEREAEEFQNFVRESRHLVVAQPLPGTHPALYGKRIIKL